MENVSAHVAERVRVLRVTRRWTAQRLAEEVKRCGGDLSRSTIAKIECGERVFITVDELVVLASALKVKPCDLLPAIEEA